MHNSAKTSLWQKWLIKYAKLNRKQFVTKLVKKRQNSGCDKHDHKRCKINQKAV